MPMRSSLTRPALLRRGLLLEYLTVGWNIIEGLIAIGAGLPGVTGAGWCSSLTMWG